MRKLSVLLFIFVSHLAWSGWLDLFLNPTPPRLQLQTPNVLRLGVDYRRIIQVHGYQNDCFFYALRQAGININRAHLIERLVQNRNNERWQTAVNFLAQQELMNLTPEEDMDNAMVTDAYAWFLNRLRLNAPITFHAYRENWETQIPDIIELLGDELRLDVRITYQGTEPNTLVVMRDFRYPRRETIRRITLRYTAGEIGHFDLVVDHEFPIQYRNFYTVDQHIGSGNQAHVYRAARNEDAKPFAVKVVDTKRHENYQAHQELDTLAKCNHPCITRVIESFEDSNGNVIAIIMELIDTTTLEKVVFSGNTRLLSDNDVMFYFVQVLIAVDYLHAQNGIHRDIKLSNILMSNWRWPKLADFGFAQIDESISHTSGCHHFLGTPYYLAPELLETPASYGQAVDVWALGVVFYILCEGRFPFNAKRHDRLFESIASAQVPELSYHRSDAMRILHKSMMQKDPALRATTQQILQMQIIRDTLHRLITNSTPEALRNAILRLLGY